MDSCRDGNTTRAHSQSGDAAGSCRGFLRPGFLSDLPDLQARAVMAKSKRGPAHPSRPPLLSARKSYLKSNPAEIEMKVEFESSVIVSSLSKIMCHLASINDVKPLNGT